MGITQTADRVLFTANDNGDRPARIPDVALISLVDLLAEAYVANMIAANDNRPCPTEEV
jgi:hypothetical protein